MKTFKVYFRNSFNKKNPLEDCFVYEAKNEAEARRKFHADYGSRMFSTFDGKKTYKILYVIEV